jgi:hypothetical protein
MDFRDPFVESCLRPNIHQNSTVNTPSRLEDEQISIWHFDISNDHILHVSNIHYRYEVIYHVHTYSILTVDVHTPKNLTSFCSRHSRCEGVKHSKLFQLFIEKRVVTITAIINNAIYNRTRIMMVLRISVYQSFEFCNFQSSFL